LRYVPFDALTDF